MLSGCTFVEVSVIGDSFFSACIKVSLQAAQFQSTIHIAVYIDNALLLNNRLFSVWLDPAVVWQQHHAVPHRREPERA
jgi:hypothetical protein